MRTDSITTTTPAPATPPDAAPATTATDAQKITRAQSLMRSAYMLADDEARPALTWTDRDELARMLHSAMQLICEVHPQQQPEGRAN